MKPGLRSQADVAELRKRMQQASLRPQEVNSHAREEAMFALHIDGDVRRALKLARVNVVRQREPVDLLLLAKAARAAKDAEAVQQVKRLRSEMGLRDERLEALL